MLGTSFGGMVALNLAVRHPDLVDRLVLWCTSPGGVAPSTATPDPEQAAGLRRQLAARAGHDVVADLSSIMQPTLVCAGRYDDIAPMENSELIADRIPDATLQVFEGGHIFMIQDRTAFPAIIDFLQDES